MNDIALSRRALVFTGLSATGALVIGVPAIASAASQPPVMADGTNPAKELTAFLIIEPDNTVTVRVPHQEMGQGTTTALAMLTAEELACDWAKVRVEYASANRNSRAGGNLERAAHVGHDDAAGRRQRPRTPASGCRRRLEDRSG